MGCNYLLCLSNIDIFSSHLLGEANLFHRLQNRKVVCQDLLCCVKFDAVLTKCTFLNEVRGESMSSVYSSSLANYMTANLE